MKEFKAKLNLLFYFIMHFIKKPFFKRRGLKDFYLAYAEDGITSVSRVDKLILEAAARCINCGLCSQGLSLISKATSGAFHLSSSLAISVSRIYPVEQRLPNFDGIEIGEGHCPCNVPLYSIQKFLNKNGAGFV